MLFILCIREIYRNPTAITVSMTVIAVGFLAQAAAVSIATNVVATGRHNTINFNVDTVGFVNAWSLLFYPPQGWESP